MGVATMVPHRWTARRSGASLSKGQNRLGCQPQSARRHRFEKEADALHHEVCDLLKRALQIGRGIGWDRPETIRARLLVNDLRKRANGRGAPIPVHWFSELDLDFGVSDPGDVAEGIDDVLASLAKHGSHETIELWRLAARAYHTAKREDDACRCQSETAECLVAEAEAALSKRNSRCSPLTT
jgi:hypothetical protein